MSVQVSPRSGAAPKLGYERQRLEDIGYMTCMTLTLLGNYAQTGHFGGPLAYTPFNVAAHLAGPELGGSATTTGAPSIRTAMSGSNTICTTTVLLETGMLPTREPLTVLTLDTPAGPVRVEATCRDGCAIGSWGGGV